MNLLTQYLKPYIGRISLGVSIKFFGSLMDLLLPWILAYIIDSVIPTKQVSAIFAWGGAMVVCSIIAVVTNLLLESPGVWTTPYTRECYVLLVECNEWME